MPNFATEALSERSRKFYDGTYSWDSEGFTDDVGVYHQFDCYDSEVRAPTPLPPVASSDSEGDPDGQQPAHGLLPEPKNANETKTLASALELKEKGRIVMVRCDELFRDRVDRERLIGKIEGVLIASRANNFDLTIEECYELCGIPNPDAGADRSLPKSITPPTSPPVKQAILHAVQIQGSHPVISIKSPQSKIWSRTSSSGLSDCRSDLSEWDVGKPVSESKTTAKATRTGKVEGEVQEPKSKPITRDIAQKVKKSAKKPAAEPTTTSSAFLSLQSGSYILGPGNAPQQRSVRRVNADGAK